MFFKAMTTCVWIGENAASDSTQADSSSKKNVVREQSRSQ